MKLGIVTPYFNLMGNPLRRRNYLRHRQSVARSGVTHVTVEFQLPGQPYDLEPVPGVVQLRTDAPKWHKTNGINIGARELLKAGCDAVMWVDADCVFPDTDWANRVADALRVADLVHTQSSFRLRATGKPEAALVAAGMQGVVDGGGWAVRAAVFEDVGHFDCVVSGANKAILTPLVPHAWSLGEIAYPAALPRYAERLARHVRSVTYVPQVVQDLDHGHRPSRWRLSKPRFELLARHRFDPDRDCYYDAAGVLLWQDPASALAAAVGRYVAARERQPRAPGGTSEARA